MNPDTVQRLWTLIRKEWRAIPEVDRPWGVWFTLHAPLVADTHMPLLEAECVQAWFLEDGMALPRERRPSSFARFWVMHMERRWDLNRCASRDPRFAARCYPLGMAAFAPYTDSQDFYLETLWGGLWGLGGRVSPTPEGLIERGEILWIS